jgi:hypothetical protein
MNIFQKLAKVWFLLALLTTCIAGCASNAREAAPIIPDTTPPTVSFTSPAHGDVGVPYDRKISVAFSEVMNPATITGAQFTVSAPGAVAVAGTVAATGASATFTPTSPLTASTTYTATITPGPTDSAGNALVTGYSWSFTTGAVADTIKPTVSFTSPTNGSTAVPSNRIIHVAFSEVMDPLTITASTFSLSGPGLLPFTTANVSGTVTPIGTSATFAPTSALAASTTYTATISTGAKDLAGNAIASTYVWSFTTGAIADIIRPTVSFTAPASGQTAVPVNRIINVAFSEPMDPLSLTTATIAMKESVSGSAVTGIVTPAGPSATFTPSSSLAFSTAYTVTIATTAQDLAGNTLAVPFVWNFTTGAVADTLRPTVSFTSPANGAVAVPTNRIINAGFSEAMDPLSITSATFTVSDSGGVPVSGTISGIGPSATFTPATPLANSTTYTATITSGVKDLAGNTLASNYVWSFTTGIAADTTAPTVTNTTPLNLATSVTTNSVVTGTFSESMDPLTITTSTFSLKETVSSINVPGTVVYAVGSKTATFTPLSALANSTNYTATIATGCKDVAGNALASSTVWSFTTGAAADSTAPTVVLVNPADLATNVALNSAVNATFSEDMAPLTITTSNFSVAGVTGVVGYNVASKVATFTPAANLTANTTYVATVTTGVTDLAGNPLALNKVWSFTTGTGLAPGAVALASAGTFGIMATSAITNTGVTTKINGDVSLDPGTSNGLLPIQVNGAIHINDSVSAQARADLLTAYNFAKTLPPGTTISAGADLGALYPLGIPPGTYTSGSTMLVTTPLILDAGGNANAVWVFQIGSSFTTGANVSLANGAQAKNVFWVPTQDGTIGVGTIFYGTIVSGRDVTAVTGAVIHGRILAGAITGGTIALDTNTVNVPAP